MMNADIASDIAQARHYKRVMLKMSGEVLMGPEEYGIHSPTVTRVAKDIQQVIDSGVEVCVVVGAGNIFRVVSRAGDGMDRTTADYMGMLGIVMNALALQNALENIGVQTRVQSAIRMDSICEPYIHRRAMRHMEKGRLVIFAAGLVNPYFSTDTTAALRANEIGAQIILKATKVDGIYDKDPKKFPDAKKYTELSFLEALQKRIKVMDATAFSLCLDNHVPVLVFNMNKEGSIRDAILGASIGTLVH